MRVCRVLLQMQTYEEAVRRLYSLQSNAAVIDAWKAERLATKTVDLREETLRHMRLLGVRIDELSVIHVAGTKGKGSVVQFAEAVARSHGVTTGSFTSPHLVEPRERIRLNGKPVSQALFAKTFFETARLLSEGGDGKLPPFFRFLNCMAFWLFQREGVQLAVVEVGVGGRTCSTNVVSPVVTAITRLGYDHMDVLGPSLTDIAGEKAGIMKRGVPCISAQQLQEASTALLRHSLEKNAFLHTVGEKSLPAKLISEFELKGDFQKENAKIGLIAARYWLAHHKEKKNPNLSMEEQKSRIEKVCNVSDVNAQEWNALKTTRWRGRAQLIEFGGKNLYLDGAHTGESCQLAIKWYLESIEKNSTSENLLENGWRVLVVNFKPNKQVDEMLGHLSQLRWNQVIFSPSAVSGSHDCSWQRDLLTRWNNLCVLKKGKCEPEISLNLTNAMELIDAKAAFNRPSVLVTGSLYLVGAALEMVKWPVDDL